MRSSLLRILALVRKEFLAVLKDPRSRVIIFLPPLLQSVIFGYAASFDLASVPYAVLDLDRSAASGALLGRLDGSGYFQRAADLSRAADLAEWIDSRRALVVLQIEPDFERRLLSGEPAPIQAIADGRNSNSAGLALSYLAGEVEAFNARWSSDHGRPGPPLRLVERSWHNPNLESRWNMLPGLIGTLTLLETMMLTAMSVAREREQGTLDQLLVTPFRTPEIMAGKALPNMAIGLTQASLVLLIAQLWFHIPFAGSYLVLYSGLGLFLLAAVGLGLLVSTLAATMQQAMLYVFLLVMPCALLSGLATPVSTMPSLLQTATLANPLRFAIDLTKRVYLQAAGFGILLPDFLALAVIGAATLAGAAWFFRRRVG